MNSDQIPVEFIVSRYMIKYMRLDQLIQFAFKGSEATHINLYIDLYGLYRTLMSRNYRTDMSDYTALTVSIINTCAHYRAYFKQIGVAATIFLISSYNLPDESLQLIPYYNKTFQEKLHSKSLKEMIELNIELLDILCPYLPGIYFIKTKFESATMINYLIQNEGMKGNEDPNIILSSDLYPIQLVNKYNNTVFLRPIKQYHEDNSVITLPKGSEGFDEMFWAVVTRSRSKIGTSEHLGEIKACNFEYLQILNSFPERNLPVILNITMSKKYINQVTNGTDVRLTLEMLYQLNSDLANRVPIESVRPRWKVLNIDYQDSIFRNSLEPKITHYEDLNDPKAVQMINSKYFANNPIDLLRL